MLVLSFLQCENVDVKYGVHICSIPVFTPLFHSPLYGPVVLINNEFQLDTGSLEHVHTHTQAAA